MFAHRSYNVAPDIIDAGQGGGGGGNITNLGMPIGSVIPFAGVVGYNGSFGVPTNWLLCDGREVRNDTYADLYNVIGFTYGVAPATTVLTGIGAYSYTGNTITFNITTANTFVKAGTYVRPADFTTTTGQNVNGTYILITSAPAIGGTGTGVGTFANPISGTGSGNATGSHSVNRASITTPNMVSRFPLGASTTTTPSNASTGGASTYQLTANNLPSHQHGVFVAGSTSLASGSGNRSGDPNVDNGTKTIAGSTYVDNGALVQNTAFSILNPYLALNYIIHAKN